MQVTQELPRLSPSAMPHIKYCPCFVQAKTPPTEKMLRGTRMDSVFRKAMQNLSMTTADMRGLQPQLTDSDLEDVLWARDEVLSLATGSPVRTAKKECRFSFDNSYGATVSGEMDAYCSHAVFDLKSGDKHDYMVQLLPYASYLFLSDPSLETLTGHLVYCSLREVDSVSYTRTDTLLRMDAFVMAWTNPNKKPLIGNACKYCRYRYAQGRCSLLAGT